MRYKEKYNWLLLLFVAICCFACTVEREPTDGYTPAGTRSEVPMSVHLGVLGAATDPEQINTAEAAIRRLRLYVFDGNVLDKMYYWDNINTVEDYTTPTFLVKAGTDKSIYVIVNEPDDADTRAQLEAVTHPAYLPEIKYSLSAMGLNDVQYNNDGVPPTHDCLPMYGEQNGVDALPSSTTASPQQLEISVDRAVARVDVYVRKDIGNIFDDFIYINRMQISNRMDEGYISPHSLPKTAEKNPFEIVFGGFTVETEEARVVSFYVPEMECRDKKVEITLEFSKGTNNNKWSSTIELGGSEGTSSPLEKIECNHVYKLHCFLTKVFQWESSIVVFPWDYVDSKIVVSQDVRITNCYIVRPGDYVDIPLKNVYAAWGRMEELGNGTHPVPSGHVEAKYVWQDVPYMTVADKAMMSGGGDRTTDYIRVKGMNEGNAIIAMTVDGKIYWSWHIWVTDYNPDNPEGWRRVNDRIWMDRNLGAMSGEYTADGAARGLIYQWGRKDPFPGTQGFGSDSSKPVYVYDSTGAVERYIRYASKPVYAGSSNLMNSIEFPDFIIYALEKDDVSDWFVSYEEDANNQLWSEDKKTIFDPCPAGWRVPDSHAFDRDGDGVTDLIYNYNNSVWGMFSTDDRMYLPYTPRYRSGAFYPEGQDYHIMNLWGCASRTNPGEISGCFESVSKLTGERTSLSHSRYRADALPVRCIKEK